MKPQFCPNGDCTAHHQAPQGRWWVKWGTYCTAIGGEVQRYKCKQCGKGFSEQTFSLDYYAKRRVGYEPLCRAVSGCMGVRALGRLFQVSPGTIENKIFRLAHQALGVQGVVWGKMRLKEDLVTDGIESFWVSQYYPVNWQVLVGAQSQFIYGAEPVTIRRKGRMRKEQKRRRAEVERRYRPPAKGLERSVQRVYQGVDYLLENAGTQPVQLRSDEHPVYPRVLKNEALIPEWIREGRLELRYYSSRLPRTIDNPLFAVNYLDRELRKDLAEHVRETTRFARSAHTAVERFTVYLWEHNYRKPFRINQPAADPLTHARKAGVSPGVIRWCESWMFRGRVFLSRFPLPRPLLDVWLRMQETPLSQKRPYLPQYALQ